MEVLGRINSRCIRLSIINSSIMEFRCRMNAWHILVVDRVMITMC